MRTLRTILLTAAALALVALPATLHAQPTIKAGIDPWETQPGSSITIGSAEWRALCGKDGPSVQVPLAGGDLAGYQQADTVIRRLQDATLSNGLATVPVRVEALNLVSDAVATPCGKLSFQIGLDDSVDQRSTSMTIVRDSQTGGVFYGDVAIDAVVTARDTSGQVVGSVPVSTRMVNPENATPWSSQPPPDATVTGPGFYAGVDAKTLAPVDQLRQDDRIIIIIHWYRPAVLDYEYAV